MKRSVFAISFVLAGLVAMGGLALGSGEGNGMTGCLTPAGTLIQIAVGDTPLRPCSHGQIQVRIGGQLTCPDGTTPFVGVCIENTARAPANQADATRDCAADGRRLPSGGELQGFRELPGITLAEGGEWTDDLGDVTLYPAFAYFAVTQEGNGVANAFDHIAYRCVAGPLP